MRVGGFAVLGGGGCDEAVGVAGVGVLVFVLVCSMMEWLVVLFLAGVSVY